MTRYAAEHIIINGQEDIEPWKNRYFIEEPEVISKLDEQRQTIDEQVEENRGLRSDVLLMQKEDAEQRAFIEQQAKEIERLKLKVDEWIRRKNEIERAYRGYGTPAEEIAKKAAWMKGQEHP